MFAIFLFEFRLNDEKRTFEPKAKEMGHKAVALENAGKAAEAALMFEKAIVAGGDLLDHSCPASTPIRSLLTLP